MIVLGLLLGFVETSCLSDEVASPTPAPAEVAPPAPAAAPPSAETPARPPLLPRQERARYRVVHALFGEVGQISVDLLPGAAGTRDVRATAAASGSLLGLGAFDKRIETEVDPTLAVPRRWTATRVQSGKTTVDTVDVPRVGKIVSTRTRAGRADEQAVLRRPHAIGDGLSFLLKLRAEPPTVPVVTEVLDGRMLWIMNVAPARRGVLLQGQSTWQIEVRATPIEWDGSPDTDREEHSFSLWLSNDALRLPLRISLPAPLGQVRIDLVAVDHPQPAVATKRTRSLTGLVDWLPRARRSAR